MAEILDVRRSGPPVSDFESVTLVLHGVEVAAVQAALAISPGSFDPAISRVLRRLENVIGDETLFQSYKAAFRAQESARDRS